MEELKMSVMISLSAYYILSSSKAHQVPPSHS